MSATRTEEGGRYHLLLRAAVSLRAPFTVADLAVAAHRESAEKFGLCGHRQYPDSRSVAAYLFHRHGLLKRGFVVRVGEGKYELTQAGRDEARPR